MNITYFSIIIPTYNRVTFLNKAIKSVLNQIFQDWELIIVDDGSTDNTKEIVKQYQEKRIKYIFQENQERSVARNNGIEQAKGEFICFLDSDDYYLNNHLEVLFNFIKIKNEEKAFYNTRLIREDSLNNRKKVEFKIDENNPAKSIFEATAINPDTVCIHKSLLVEDKFPEEFNIWEDTHLWVRLACKHKFYQIEEYTVVQKDHEQRGVNIDFQKVNLEKVNLYILCINDLFINNQYILEKINKKNKTTYIKSKYEMFIYQARINKQFREAFLISNRMIQNRCNIDNILIFIKLIIHNIFDSKRY